MGKKSFIRRLPALCALLIMAVSLSHGAETRSPQSYNSEGWDFLKRGDNYRAVFSFKNALQKNPRYREALLGLGASYLEVGANDQAIEYFSQVLKIDKNSDAALTGLGHVFTRLGKYTQAMEYFTGAVKISEENVDAKYGIANLYYAMDKIIWARRKIDGILKLHPFHVDTILLLAEIKSRENRLDDARKLAEKAIELSSESPRGYAKLGEVLFRDYLGSENQDSLESAREAVKNALSIQPGNYAGNRLMGNMSLYQGIRSQNDEGQGSEYLREAADYFLRARKIAGSAPVLYSLGVAQDLLGDHESALGYFLSAFKQTPYDPILIGRIEDFLVLRDYKIGHPAREMLNKDYARLARKSMEKNLMDETILYLRRALLLNPMDRAAREELMGYYGALDYHRFYIDEMKTLLRLFPEKKYQDMLGTAVLKRRSRLYHREGFSDEMPPRDVPRVLVMNFDSPGAMTDHPDAGEVIGNMLAFVMGQYGRMAPVGIRKRSEAARGLYGTENYLRKSMEAVSAMAESGKLDPVEYVVYGSFRESPNFVSVKCSVLDLARGVVIGDFTLSESGKESLMRLSIRAARRIYSMIPYRGRIMKLGDDGIVVNLGTYDGLTPGDKLVVNKYGGDRDTRGVQQKLIFVVREADTVISYAVPEKKSDLEIIFASDPVYPLKKRRARLVK